MVCFEMRAEQMATVLNAFERKHQHAQLTQFANHFHGFLADRGTTWGHNEYNHDILWMVIACTRELLLTGTSEFRDVARINPSRADKKTKRGVGFYTHTP